MKEENLAIARELEARLALLNAREKLLREPIDQGRYGQLWIGKKNIEITREDFEQIRPVLHQLTLGQIEVVKQVIAGL